jgi:nitroreductase
LEKKSVYMNIKRRRTIRKYIQTAVPEEVLLKCVDSTIFRLLEETFSPYGMLLLTMQSY